jgi:nucleotide-binding universal stress UspA family protein
MADTILIPYDGSEGSERALQHAVSLAQRSGALLVLAAVVEWRLMGSQNPLEVAHAQIDVLREVERVRDEILKPRCARLAEQGLSAQAVVELGPVVASLLEIGARHHVSSIVCGRRGHSRLSRLLMGAVASGLVQTAPFPVTVVP